MHIAPNRRGHLKGLLELLGRGIVSGDDADALVHLLRGALGIHGFVLAQNGDMSAWNATAGVPAEWVEKHKEHGKEDPSVEVLGRMPPGSFYFVERDLPVSDRTTPLHDAFIACGLRDAAIGKLHSPFLGDLFLALYRHDGAPHFSEDDRLLLALLHPHLVAGLATRSALAAVQRPDRAMRAQAYARLSWPAEQIEWSDKARFVWTERLGPMGAAAWGRVERAMWRAAAIFLSAQYGGRSQLILPALRVEFAYVPVRGRESRAMLAMFQDEAAAGDDASPGSPAEEFLTPRERAVARGVAGGASLACVAATQGVSRETARTHLRAVYEKLGVSRRTELTAILGRPS